MTTLAIVVQLFFSLSEGLYDIRSSASRVSWNSSEETSTRLLPLKTRQKHSKFNLCSFLQIGPFNSILTLNWRILSLVQERFAICEINWKPIFSFECRQPLLSRFENLGPLQPAKHFEHLPLRAACSMRPDFETVIHIWATVAEILSPSTIIGIVLKAFEIASDSTILVQFIAINYNLFASNP